jgi:hypothetical protein
LTRSASDPWDVGRLGAILVASRMVGSEVGDADSSLAQDDTEAAL